MRTTDFSAGPPQARAGAFFLGCNMYHSPVGMIRQLFRWPKVAAALRAFPGYLWHRSYYHFPLGIGLIVGFDDHEALKAFARTPEHREIMHWLVGTDEPGRAPVKGGFIRILTAEEFGYANGPWHVDGQLRMIDTFAPLPDEATPPSTAPTTRRAVGPARTVRSLLALARTMRKGRR